MCFGQTAKPVEQAHTKSHFQNRVLNIGNYSIVPAITLVVAIITVALPRLWLRRKLP